MISRAAVSLVVAQALSLFGSSMTRFAVAAWVYEATGSVGAFSTLAILGMLPGIVASPIAGALVDRLRKRTVLVTADVASALGTLLVLATALDGQPALAAVYFATVVASIADAHQWPALSATVARLAGGESLARLNGLLEAGRSAALVAAPALGGLLYAYGGFTGTVIVEIATCALSVALLFAVRFADEPVARAPGETPSLRAEIAEGLAFLRGHFGLKYLLAFFVFVNLCASVGMVLLRPFQLALLGTKGTGFVEAIFGVGLLAGGALLGATGGPRRKATAVAAFGLVEGAVVFTTGSLSTLPALATLSFMHGMFLPLLNGCSQTVWQTNTPLPIQGRVFSVRRMFAWMTNPLGFALATPLAVAGGKLRESSTLFGAWPLGEPGGLGVTISGSGLALMLLSAVVLASGVLRRLDETVVEDAEIPGEARSAG